MMIVLPIAVLLLLTMLVYTRSRPDADSPASLRRAILIATSFCGAYLALSTEVLSLFGALTRSSILWVWGLPTVLLAVWLLRMDILRQVRSASASPGFLRSWDAVNLTAVGLALLALLVVALRSPPNNVDSLLYHLSRVAHWAQNRSLAHYPTSYELQLIFPIWAELAILHLRLLWGNDLLAGTVQWGSMLLSLIGVSGIAALLGANRPGQVFSSAVAFSIPMGLLQATSTQNDYVAALWLTALAFFTVVGVKRPLDLWEWGAAGCALGLGMLTKGTFYVFALPFVVWMTLNQTARTGWRRSLLRMSAIGLLALLLNAGFFMRNIRTYGAPLGSGDVIGNHRTANLLPGSMLASLITESAVHFATPSESVNEKLEAAVNRMAQALGSADPEFQVIWFWNHEDFAGSPLHMATAALAPLPLIWVFARSRHFTPRRLYAVISLASFALFALLLKWQFFNVRLHLPFFIVWSPVVGMAAAVAVRDRGLRAFTTALIILSVPWVLLNNTRPLIGLKPRTSIDGIFAAPLSDILLANHLQFREPYLQAAGVVLDSECRQIGLRIDSHDPEYAFWWLLDEPQGPRRIETVHTFPHLERYRDPAFQPCLIVCTICSSQTSLPGFELQHDFGDVLLYADNP